MSTVEGTTLLGTEQADGPAVAALLRAPEELDSPVLRVLAERAREGSRPGCREDDHVVCLGIEGGGMRGTVSAGMCVLLEAAGLTSAFDRIYGVSAGALNGWATAAGQAALGATHYQDAAAERVVSRVGPLRGRPFVDLDLLFEELIAVRKPLSFERLADGPDLRVLATSLETMSLRVLSGFADLHELMLSVRASAFFPRLSGEPPVIRGERMADGSLLEPIPYSTPLAEGATHVLVLRSRPAAYRKPGLVELGEALTLRDDPRVWELLRARQGIYNRQAAQLQRAAPNTPPYLHQVAVPGSARLLRSMQSNGGRVTDALRLGVRTMARDLLRAPVDLRWQPLVVPGAAVATAAAQVTPLPVRSPALGA